jgi:hypothetical protein
MGDGPGGFSPRIRFEVVLAHGSSGAHAPCKAPEHAGAIGGFARFQAINLLAVIVRGSRGSGELGDQDSVTEVQLRERGHGRVGCRARFWKYSLALAVTAAMNSDFASV